MKVSYASHIAELKVISQSFEMNALLLSPQTFMNIIGKNVAKAMRSEKIEKANLIVIHDDLEQKLGRVRVVKGTSFKGHNGLKSISQELGGFKDFTRFGVGIGRPEARDQGVVADYVLSNFSQSDLETLQNEVFSKVYERIVGNKLEPDGV